MINLHKNRAAKECNQYTEYARVPTWKESETSRHARLMNQLDWPPLATLDESARERLEIYSAADFPSLLHTLVTETQSPVVRAKLRDNQTSFDGILQTSRLASSLLGFPTLLIGILYMAIHQASRDAERNQRSEQCLHSIIDKLRRCSQFGVVFHSRCSDSRVPVGYAKERLSQAYHLHLTFLNSIVQAFERGPLGMPCPESQTEQRFDG